MNAQHTPGTWQARGFAVYCGHTKGLVAAVMTTHLADTIQDDVYREMNERSGINEQEAYANAALIARAPDLLRERDELAAALRAFVDSHDSATAKLHPQTRANAIARKGTLDNSNIIRARSLLSRLS